MRNLAVLREKLSSYPELVRLAREFLRLKGRIYSETIYTPSNVKKKNSNELRSNQDETRSFLYKLQDSSPDISICELWDDCVRVVSSDAQRRKRLTKRLKSMFQLGECIFLTLTFKDAVLDSTSFETRRRYVTRYLQSQGVDFVGNVDFGGKNGREHYHAVIRADSVDFAPWYEFGGIKAKKCVRDDKSARKMSGYITKLVGHAFKDSTKNAFSLIYSRSKKEKFVSVPLDELPF